MYYSVRSMRRSEVALWESVLSLHHVELGTPVQVVGLATTCLHPLPSLLATCFSFFWSCTRQGYFFVSVFGFTDIFVVSVIVNRLRSSLPKYLVWA